MARAPLLDHDQRAGEHRRRPLAGRGKHQMDRPLDRRALGDVDDAPSRISAVLSATTPSLLGRHDLAEMRRDQRIAGRQRLRHRADASGPATDPSRSDSSGTNVPSTNTMRRDVACRRSAGRRALARALAAASGAPASGLASRISARRSVYFHSSIRRCGRPSASKRPNAASRSATTLPSPGSVGLADANASASACSAVGLHGADFGVHGASAASSWYCA